MQRVMWRWCLLIYQPNLKPQSESWSCDNNEHLRIARGAEMSAHSFQCCDWLTFCYNSYFYSSVRWYWGGHERRKSSRNVGPLDSALWLAVLALQSQVGQLHRWIDWADISATLPPFTVSLGDTDLFWWKTKENKKCMENTHLLYNYKEGLWCYQLAWVCLFAIWMFIKT